MCLVHRSLKRKGANDFQLSSLSDFGSWATGAGKDKLFELGYPCEMATGSLLSERCKNSTFLHQYPIALSLLRANHMVGY
jgi:hypothetical protein